MSNLVVCPKAGECNIRYRCPHRVNHDKYTSYVENCDNPVFRDCPACTPVKPEVKQEASK